jgi:DNA polymerase-1
MAEAYKLMHNGVLAFSRMEHQGLRVDIEYIHRKKEELTKEIKKLEISFKETPFYIKWRKSTQKPINIYSHIQLGTFLYDRLKLESPKKTKSGKGSTDEDTIKQLHIPDLDILLRIAKLKKIRDTYLDSFLREQVNGYLHPFFNLHLVTTYRSSSDSPNFQNIPKRDEEAMNICRGALFPRPGNQLLELDYSGIEFRIAGCYYKDETMLKYINDPSSDIHGFMASKLFKIKNFDEKEPTHSYLRSAAKNGFVFPQLYGSWYKSCANNLINWGNIRENEFVSGKGVKIGNKYLTDYLASKGIESYTDFESHIRTVENYFWKNIFKTGKQWQDNFWKEYQKNGVIYSYTGFAYSGVMSLNNVLNYPIQGDAFHVLLWSLIEADKALLRCKFKTRILTETHDSILLDVYPPELKQIINILRCIMCNDVKQHWKWIIVPLDIKAELCPIDKSWADKKSYKLPPL